MTGNPPSRKALLDAARDLILNGGLDHESILTAERVFERAGISHTTFYKQFNKATFANELLRSLVEDNPRTTIGLLAQKLHEKLIDSKGDPRPAIREICEWDFNQVRSDPGMLTLLFITLFARSREGVIQAVRTDYRRMTEDNKGAYEDVMGHWGVAIRKPFTSYSVAILFTALVEGLSLRWLLDPEAIPEGLFGDAIVAFVAAIVDREQSGQHIDDIVAPLADALMREFRLSEAERNLDNPRQAILAAAKEQFAQRGFSATQLEHVASTAGVSMNTLWRLFPNKIDLVTGGLKPVFEDLKGRVSDDIRMSRTEVDVLNRYMKRISDMVIEHRTMFDALLAVITQEIALEPEKVQHIRDDLDFAGLVTPTIDAGQRAGVFTNTMSAPDIATMLTNTILMWCFINRDQTAQETVAVARNLFLNGILIENDASAD